MFHWTYRSRFKDLNSFSCIFLWFYCVWLTAPSVLQVIWYFLHLLPCLFLIYSRHFNLLLETLTLKCQAWCSVPLVAVADVFTTSVCNSLLFCSGTWGMCSTDSHLPIISHVACVVSVMCNLVETSPCMKSNFRNQTIRFEGTKLVFDILAAVTTS